MISQPPDAVRAKQRQVLAWIVGPGDRWGVGSMGYGDRTVARRLERGTYMLTHKGGCGPRARLDRLATKEVAS